MKSSVWPVHIASCLPLLMGIMSLESPVKSGREKYVKNVSKVNGISTAVLLRLTNHRRSWNGGDTNSVGLILHGERVGMEPASLALGPVHKKSNLT